MLIIFLTIAISLTLAFIFLFGFIWSTKSGQYDDLITPGHRILIDDVEIKNKKKNKEEETDGNCC